ncbi:MAG TPA: hypothetical protein VGK40_05150 [Verrucomicrobiae bacterium]|jgi:hypothetical protein
MKNRIWPAAMLAVMSLCVLCTFGFLVRYCFALKELRGLQQRFNASTRNVRLAQELARECVEYSKRNPAIDPVLQSFDLKRASTNLGPSLGPLKPSGQ